MPEVNHERSRNIGSYRLRKMLLHILEKALLVCQLRLSLEIIVNHRTVIYTHLPDFRKMILVQAS